MVARYALGYLQQNQPLRYGQPPTVRYDNIPHHKRDGTAPRYGRSICSSTIRRICGKLTACLCVVLPLPVIPLFVHDELGFSNLGVGLVIGIRLLATLLTRGYAGRLTDQHGGKRSVLQGAPVCALGGLFDVIAAAPGLLPGLSVGIVVAGRLAASVDERQFVTGCVSWSIASVGPQHAGMSMSWTGIAMFAARAIGAPVAMIACIVAPIVAIVVAFRDVSYTAPAGRRLPFYRVIGQIWHEGLGLSGLTAFASLYFAACD